MATLCVMGAAAALAECWKRFLDTLLPRLRWRLSLACVKLSLHYSRKVTEADI